MGITDKITGRLKQAAGDLTGREDVRRDGVEEERKGEAKEELAREEARLERTEESVEARQEAAERRAARAAREEYARADTQIEAEESRLQREEDRLTRREAEVDALERRTNPERLAEDRTREELYERARELAIEGRAEMTKEELADAVRRAE